MCLIRSRAFLVCRTAGVIRPSLDDVVLAEEGDLHAVPCAGPSSKPTSCNGSYVALVACSALEPIKLRGMRFYGKRFGRTRTGAGGAAGR